MTDNTETLEVDVDAIASRATRLLPCTVKGCPRVFETTRGRTNHINTVHNRGGTTPNVSHVPDYQPPETILTKDGKFGCSACDYVADLENSLTSHKRTHFKDAREAYVRDLEKAAREVGTLRKALREANIRVEADVAIEEVKAQTTGGDTLTVDTAIDFIRDQFYSADQELIALTAELKDLRGRTPAGDATATMELIRDAFTKFYTGDQTMTRFVTEVEDALRLMYPDITEE